MAMNWIKVFSRRNWKNFPSLNTPIDEVNLNAGDYALDVIDDRVLQLDTIKADQTTVNGTLTNVELNKETGVFTITRVDGSSFIIESNLAKVVTNFFFDKTTQTLILTLPDGTTQPVDFSAFITDYEFVDTDRITFSISGDGKVSADIKKGSITGEYLEPNYLADIRLESAKAQKSAEDSESWATKSYDYSEIAKREAAKLENLDATDVAFADTEMSATNVDEALRYLKEHGGGSGNANAQEIAESEYQGLPQDEKENGTIYFSPDGQSQIADSSFISYDGDVQGARTVKGALNILNENLEKIP